MKSRSPYTAASPGACTSAERTIRSITNSRAAGVASQRSPVLRSRSSRSSWNARQGLRPEECESRWRSVTRFLAALGERGQVLRDRRVEVDARRRARARAARSWWRSAWSATRGRRSSRASSGCARGAPPRGRAPRGARRPRRRAACARAPPRPGSRPPRSPCRARGRRARACAGSGSTSRRDHRSPTPNARFEQLERPRTAVERSARADRPRAVVLGSGRTAARCTSGIRSARAISATTSSARGSG